ncbi:hypothetical protein BKA69DRAFT_383892 [Paraphysoderma sedebokerense]|nr:hypothetical protein BKA69DRAFT_383892 [Paraphysoderma sedebokerense]
MSGANQNATSNSSSNPQLSSSQIAQMMTMSALVFARISYLFGIDQDNVMLLYDLALSTRWECYTEITRQISDNANETPFQELEMKIAQLMTENIAPPMKKQPNLIFLMQEAAIVAGALNLTFSKIRRYLLLNLFVSKGGSSQNVYIESVELALDLCIGRNIADLCTDIVMDFLQSSFREQISAIDSVDEPVLRRILTIIIRGWKSALDLDDAVRLFRFTSSVESVLELEQFRILPVEDILELKILRLETRRACSRTLFSESIELYNLIEDLRSEYNKPKNEQSEKFSIINAGLNNEWIDLSESKLWLSKFRQISDDIGWIQ